MSRDETRHYKGQGVSHEEKDRKANLVRLNPKGSYTPNREGNLLFPLSCGHSAILPLFPRVIQCGRLTNCAIYTASAEAAAALRREGPKGESIFSILRFGS